MRSGAIDVREVRLANGLTQREVAGEARITPRTLRRLESGRRVRVSTWVQVFEALGRLAGDVAGLSDGQPIQDRGLVAAILERFDIPPGKARLAALVVVTALGRTLRPSAEVS